MKSAQIKGYGGNDMLEISHNMPSSGVSEGKVLVIIKAAGVNPVDWKMREGYLQEKVKLQFPSRLGMDFSGIVKKAPNKAGVFKRGDEVYGQASVIAGGSGAFAEMALAPVQTIALKPTSLSHVEAAGLPLAGVSAWQALVENIRLHKGQKILIHGGAGGIGSIAIQLAKTLETYVTTTVSSIDKQFVWQLGADEVIDYKNQKFEETLNDYDAVLDTVGGETYTRSFKVLKKGGIIVSMLEQPNAELMNTYGAKAVFLFTQVNNDRLTRLAQWVDKNDIKVNVEKTFTLDKTGKALDYVRYIHPRGKVILAIQSPTWAESLMNMMHEA
jgi:alcohol dehydrogenase